MSLYNTLFGQNKRSGLLLALLGTREAAIPRFRDCYISEGRIVIHTRTGGGNREFYESRDGTPNTTDGPCNDDLRKLPGFAGDSDDSFDSTYADFYFDPPEDAEELITAYGSDVPPNERWASLLEKMKSGDTSDPEVREALTRMEPTMRKLEEALKTGGGGIIEV